MTYIEGKIADIIDEYTVVLNIGHEQNIEEGMRFIIYKKGKEIKDPETGDSLGYFENVKAKVKVTNVAEKYSTATSDETTLRPINYLMNSFNGTERKKLLFDEGDSKNFIDDIDKVIKIGDLVRLILD